MAGFQRLRRRYDQARINRGRARPHGGAGRSSRHTRRELGRRWHDRIWTRGSGSSGLWRVPAGGGQPRELTQDPFSPRHRHVWPDVLPGRCWQSCSPSSMTPTATSRRSPWPTPLQENSGCSSMAVRSLATWHPATSRMRPGPTCWRCHSTSNAGRWQANQRLWSRAFSTKPFGLSDFAVARGGTLAYIAGRLRMRSHVSWSGSAETARKNHWAHQLARTSIRVSLRTAHGSRSTSATRKADIWTWDIARRTLTRLTFGPQGDEYPVWTPDSRRLVFGSGPTNAQNHLFASGRWHRQSRSSHREHERSGSSQHHPGWQRPSSFVT